MKVIGIVLVALAAFAVLGFFASASENGVGGDDISTLIFVLFIAAGGVVLIRRAKKLDSEAESIKRYISIVVNGGVRQLETIASTTGKPYEVVYSDIQKMISKGYLKNAYIDEGMKQVVLPSDTAAPQTDAGVAANAASAPAQPKIVTCSCCGANNTIYGDVGECEYCGSPLK